MAVIDGLLEARVGEAFGAQGDLALADPGFKPREAQTRMALAVGQALQTQRDLIVEAGTGVGKTFAYLVPVLLSRRRCLVSTATKALQDQLFHRDLPRITRALRWAAKVVMLKGRSSYLCLHRLERAREAPQWSERWAQRLLARIETWSHQTNSGDLSEVEGLDEQSAVLPAVSSTRDNCLGTSCPRWSDCHVVQARRQALQADVVVVNHHLFFADQNLRDTGVAELLPSVDVVVFDEAHQLMETGLAFLGQHLSHLQLLDLAREIRSAVPALAPGVADWAGLSAQLELSAQALAMMASELRPPKSGPHWAGRVEWARFVTHPEWSEVLARVGKGLSALYQALVVVQGTSPDLARLMERVQFQQELLDGFMQATPADVVRWVELNGSSLRLSQSPLEIRERLRAQREQSAATWLFTSATLGDDEGLTWFRERTGMDQASVLRVGSPFDYAGQARLWVPTAAPLPQDVDHPEFVAQTALEVAQVLEGRTFVLTTTLRALSLIAHHLRLSLADRGLMVEVLVQGEDTRQRLLQRFGDGQGRILVGSQSFWEGVDVPGDALQCVVIDKLPFPPPHDPLMRARAQQIEAEGGDAFERLFLAEAAVSLKQGAGRLIRTENDQGLLVICDPRLLRMGYGRRLMRSLPPMSPLFNPQDVSVWLRGLREQDRI